MAVVRIFYSAVDPSDSDAVRRVFVEDVRPAFESAGCEQIELLVNTEPSAGGLLEGVVLSRWPSIEQVEAALASRSIAESLVRVRQMLRLEPIVRTFEVLE